MCFSAIFTRLSKVFVMTLSLLMSFMSLAQTAHAQRALDNTGFESNDPGGPGNTTFKFFPKANVPGWDATQATIEIWDSGFQSVPSHSGSRHAEMNAKSPGTLFQNICIENGETVGWTFAHRARSGGADPQIASFEIATLSGTVIQTMATQTTAIGAGWQVNSGTTTYTGTGGVVRVQFRTTNAGSVGNFLDTIEIDLSAYVEFDEDSSDSEAGTTLPAMTINGTVDATTTVPFTITGGTATLGDDYIVNDSVVTVPPGVYNNIAFPLPITILNDSDFETLDETITFSIGTPSSTELKVSDASCGAAAKTEHTHIIIDDDPSISATKDVMMYDDPSRTDDLYAVPGNDVIYTFTLTNEGHGPTDTDSLFLVDVLPSEIVFYNGDMDGVTGAGTDPVLFSQTNTALTFNYNTDVGFSKNTSRPASFAECMDAPNTTYDISIKFICFNPKGDFSAGDPTPTAELQFRAQIK
jgi:uncharacterized repeat protein (TIGR01451 family)